MEIGTMSCRFPAHKIIKGFSNATICVILSLCLSCGVRHVAGLRNNNEIVPVLSSTDSNSVANHAFHDLLVVATLDGHLHGVRKSTGEIAWTVRDSQGKVNVLPRPKPTDKKLFLPDPRDGSLYFFDIDAGIRKLPMSIPEFVGAAPSRSPDGLFYTGRKHASWIAINPVTGVKWELQGDGADDASCPSLTDRNSILIPKVEYVLSLFDVNSRTNWNATYRHYGVWSRSQPELDPFDKATDDGSFLLSSTNGGHLVKMNAVEKKLKWCSKFESPVVNVFSPSALSGSLLRYAFYSMPDEAMQHVLNKDFRRLNKLMSAPTATTSPVTEPLLPRPKNNNKQQQSSRRTLNKLKGFLEPTRDSRTQEATSVRIRERLSNSMALYIGHFNNEMYAMPSLSDNNLIEAVDNDAVGDKPAKSTTTSSLFNEGVSLRIPSDDDETNEEYAQGETGLINVQRTVPASCYIPAVSPVPSETPEKVQPPLIAGPSITDEEKQVGKASSPQCTTSFCPPQLTPPITSSSDADQKPDAENITVQQPAVPSRASDRDKFNDVTKRQQLSPASDVSSDINNASCIVEDSPLAAFLGLHVLPRQEDLFSQVLSDSDGDGGSSRSMDWHAISSHRTPLIGKFDEQKLISLRYWNSTSMLVAVLLGLLIGFLGVMAIAYFSPLKLFNANAVSSLSSSSRSSETNGIANGSGNRHSGHSVDRIVVGNKMEYYPNKLLGRGCDGTCVFKGRFDNRDVAVKRLLPDCFRLADREVAIMKSADTHPNVIRYYCTEADSQFRYIALELCQATLTDYVEGKTELELDMKFVLLQAMNGLKHLHSLNIVHRDVKPRNVLLAYAPGDNNTNNANVVAALGVSHAGMHNVGDDAQRAIWSSQTARVRVLISDFGLCKQVTPGRVSLTQHTGLIGTEGWIAPELVLAQRLGQTAHVSKSMDIFSMGCLFYYCLTSGGHPYGEEFSRQVSIVQGLYSLKTLDQRGTAAAAGGGGDQEAFLAAHLIEQMIQHDPSMRPTAACVMSHPYFWTRARRLAFLQDVSDRIEKTDTRSPIIRALENNNRLVVERDWMRLVGGELQRDLQVRRTYNRSSVRDLLRAIRNKKHHYSELSEAVRAELGELTDAFLDYFTSRFPRLFMHVYVAMQLHAHNTQDGGGQNISAYYSPESKWMALRVPAENWRDAENGDADDADAAELADGSPEKLCENGAESPQPMNGRLLLSSSPLRNGGGSPSKNLRRPPAFPVATGFGLPKWHANNKNGTVPAGNMTSFAVNNATVSNWQPTPDIDVDENDYVDEYFPNGNPNKNSSPRAEPRKVPNVLQKLLDRHQKPTATGVKPMKNNAWQTHKPPASQPWQIISVSQQQEVSDVAAFSQKEEGIGQSATFEAVSKVAPIAVSPTADEATADVMSTDIAASAFVDGEK